MLNDCKKFIHKKLSHIFLVFEVLSGRALYLGQKPIWNAIVAFVCKKKGYHIEYQKYYIPFHIRNSSEKLEKKSDFFCIFL